MIRLIALAVGLFTVSLAQAEVRVSATTTSMAVLARTVGGDAVTVTTLAPPDRDVHYLQAKPSMLHRLRRADLLVAIGAELEVGWLPAALRRAANPRIRPGRTGYFEAAAQVELAGSYQRADRSGGDVHPAGDPHVSLDPVRMAALAEALAARLGELDPGQAETFRQGAADFRAKVEECLPAWQEKAAGSPGVVAFHKDIDYLMHRLEVPIHGYLEPKPGIPPSAAHLKGLIANLERREPGVILRHPYHPCHPVRKVARAVGWRTASLPMDPPIGAGAEEYFALIDAYVAALEEGR